MVHNDAQHYTPRHVIRTHWNAYEPMLVSEALFAVGNVFRSSVRSHTFRISGPVHACLFGFSFARIIYLFQTNPYLGPLQISLGCMLVDVAKFCFIFVLIISSFSIGLAQLYWYYDSQTVLITLSVFGPCLSGLTIPSPSSLSSLAARLFGPGPVQDCHQRLLVHRQLLHDPALVPVLHHQSGGHRCEFVAEWLHSPLLFRWSKHITSPFGSDGGMSCPGDGVPCPC